MAQLIDDWLRPIIDTHFPALFQFSHQSSTTTDPALTQLNDWQQSSPGSQHKYKTQYLLSANQPILKLRLWYAEGSSECLQLNQYFDRVNHNECVLSDGRHKIKTRFSKLGRELYRKNENHAPSELSCGDIIQVRLFSILFSIKSQGNIIYRVDTHLEVHSFKLLARGEHTYGHPKEIEGVDVLRQIIGQEVPVALHHSRNTTPAKASGTEQISITLIVNSSPDITQRVCETPQRKDGREPSQELGSPPVPRGKQRWLREAELGVSDPSVQVTIAPMAAVSLSGKLPVKANHYSNWHNFRRLPQITRRLCTVPADQSDILQSGQVWIPPDEGDFTGAPLPAKLKQDLHRARLEAEQVAYQTKKSSDPHSLKANNTNEHQKASRREWAVKGTEASGAAAGDDQDDENEDDEQDSDSSKDSDQPISSWEDSPPQPPRNKRLLDLPPDSPEPASSIMAPSSPQSLSAHRPKVNENPSVHGSETTRMESRSRSASVGSLNARHRQGLSARNQVAQPPSTPLCDRAPYIQPATANPDAWLSSSSKWGPQAAAGRITATQSHATSMKQITHIGRTVPEKRKIVEILSTSKKRRNNFGLSREPSISQNPNRQINDLKRQVIDLCDHQSPVRADPPSSRVPETQFTPGHNASASKASKTIPSTVTTPVPSHISTTSKTPQDQEVKQQRINGKTAVVLGGDPFVTFKNSYPSLLSDKTQFAKLCKLLSTVQNTFPKLLWDDFIMRHMIDYKPYVDECVCEMEQPKGYIEFCGDFEVKYNKRVMTTALLMEALNAAS